MALEAIRTLRTHLEAHSRDPRARMVNLDGTLLALRNAFDEVERRQGLLAAAYLQLLESFVLDHHPHRLQMHPAALEAIGELGDHAGMLARRLASLVTGESANGQ